MFSGTTSALATCEGASSTTMTMKSWWWAALTWAKKAPIRSVFMAREIIQSSSPSSGLTTP
jgi:hypothetical protein